MQARLRSAVGSLCRVLTEAFAPSFGAPSDLSFGQSAAEGTSEAFARADHEHGMPEVPADTLDQLDQKAFAFSDLVFSTTAGIVDVDFNGSIALSDRDTSGETGCFGGFDLSTGITTTGSVNAGFSQGALVTTNQNIYVPRVREFVCRMMPTTLTADLDSIFCVVGAIRTGSANRVDGVQDGAYFYLATDGSGVGTWKARLTAASNTTEVDTGVSPRGDGTNNYFDTFRISFDGTAWAFSINGEVVATITDLANMPGATRKVAFWGCGLTKGGGAVNKTLVVDMFLYSGLRVAV